MRSYYYTKLTLILLRFVVATECTPGQVLARVIIGIQYLDIPVLLNQSCLVVPTNQTHDSGLSHAHTFKVQENLPLRTFFYGRDAVSSLRVKTHH